MAQRAANPIEIFVAARRRMVVAFGVLAVVYAIGAAGYWYLGGGRWSLGDCIYMTAITVTTVGFEEIIDISEVPGGRVWTVLLLVFGISANLYVVSAITSFFVESDFSDVRRYRRQQKMMEELSDHYIVCGVGRTGAKVVEELIAVGHRVVAIDERAEFLEEQAERGALTLNADATDDETLEKAGIDRARGVVATLDDDKTNMFVVVTARQTNPKLRIVAKSSSASAGEKLRRAGADAVVSPTSIGGMRLASELVRPQVVQFLDEMLRDRDANLRIEEAHIGPNTDVLGQTLSEADLRHRCGVLLLAIKDPAGTLRHSPGANHKLEAGQTLIAMGRPEQITALRETVDHR